MFLNYAYIIYYLCVKILTAFNATFSYLVIRFIYHSMTRMGVWWGEFHFCAECRTVKVGLCVINKLCTAHKEESRITKATELSFPGQQSVPASAVELRGCAEQLPDYKLC